jgi:hypothetical protein
MGGAINPMPKKNGIQASTCLRTVAMALTSHKPSKHAIFLGINALSHPETPLAEVAGKRRCEMIAWPENVL